MKSWKVQIRGKSGKTESIYIDADDRSSVFKIARERSLTIISVDEAKGKRPSSADGKPAVGKGLVAGLIVAICGALAVWYFLPREAPKPAPVEEKAKKPKSTLPDVKYTAPKSVEKPIEEVKPEKKVDPELVAIREKVKNMTPEEKQAFAEEMIKNRQIDFTPTTNHPFRTGLEFQMARIFITKLGDVPPPLFPITKHDALHFEEILNADNPIIDGDAEVVAEAKEMVTLAKQELQQFIKDGGEPEDFLAYYHGKLVSAYEERKEGLKEIVRISQDSPEIARAFYEGVNKDLAERGIKPIELSDKVKQRLGLED